MEEVLKAIGLLLLGGICLACIVFEIYIWCKYGNMPAGEVPAWVMWFMGR